MGKIPTIESEPHPDGGMFIAKCNDAKIEYALDNPYEKTLLVNLYSGNPIANHVMEDKRGIEGIVILTDLFGKKEDKEWGKEQKDIIESREKHYRNTFIGRKIATIATKQHPIRWTSGRGAVFIGDGRNFYLVLNKRGAGSPTDEGVFADMGGYGEKEDLFNPVKGAHREIAEELIMYAPDEKILIPKFNPEQDRGVDFEKIILEACFNTGLTRTLTKNIKAVERKDLSRGSRVIVALDGKKMCDESVLFLYDPLANCGIDVQTPVEYFSTCDLSKDVSLGFGEHVLNKKDGKYISFGKQNDMFFVPIYDLLNEFQEKNPKAIDVIRMNIYNNIRKEEKLKPTNLNESVKSQLDVMKNKNYKFGGGNNGAKSSKFI